MGIIYNTPIPFEQYRGKIIGLCGYARVGKDSICRELNLPRAAFADALKEDIGVLPGVRRLINGWHMTPDEKEIFRPTMVEYGKACRRFDKDYWIKRLMVPDKPMVCITDVRYLNEVAWIERKGGLVIRIRRPDHVPANVEEADSFKDITRNCPLMPHVWNFDGKLAEAAAEANWIIQAKFAEAA